MKPSAEPTLLCEHLKLGYGNHVVCADLSFQVNPGEVVCILGANGSGKSTLIKSLGSMIPKLDGRITVQGQDFDALDFRDRGQLFAVVPQTEEPLLDFTVMQMVVMGRFPVSPGLFDTAEDEAAARTALQHVQGEHLADRHFNQLSGGEKQRVLIARALAQDTPILLLDEPSSHLDLHHQKELVELVRSLKEKTLLIAVHDVNLAFALSNRTIILQNGAIVHDGELKTTDTIQLLEAMYGVQLGLFVEDGEIVIVGPLY